MPTRVHSSNVMAPAQNTHTATLSRIGSAEQKQAALQLLDLCAHYKVDISERYDQAIARINQDQDYYVKNVFAGGKTSGGGTSSDPEQPSPDPSEEGGGSSTDPDQGGNNGGGTTPDPDQGGGSGGSGSGGGGDNGGDDGGLSEG